jgi:4-hydroxy-3-polyprenylbenzoate decarboxylase
MSYKDVREWIRKVDEMGELKIVEGADWNLEIGALSVLASKHKENSPALLFDRIKDYPAGYRILVGFFESLKRSALTTNLPLDITREGFIQAWRERLARPAYIPPATVKSGPVMENVFSGGDIDLFKFPVPFWHERDGGRYIGTGHVVITRDPDEDWVNVGCYRVMVHDRNSMGMNISPGKHGRMHRQKYFAMIRLSPLRQNTARRRAPSIVTNCCARRIFAIKWKKPACRTYKRWRVIFAGF